MAESDGANPVAVKGRGTALWTLTLDRPDRRNAIDEAMQVAILAEVQAAAQIPLCGRCC